MRENLDTVTGIQRKENLKRQEQKKGYPQAKDRYLEEIPFLANLRKISLC